MGKTVVIYKSKYGSTKRYAEWIAKELDCGLLENSNLTADMLKSYDTVIYGGNVFAGTVSGIGIFKKFYYVFKTKNVIIFTCGLMDYSLPENIIAIEDGMDNALKGLEFRTKRYYHFRGAMEFENLKFFDKMLISMIKKKISKADKGTMTEEENKMSQAFSDSVDYTDKNAIIPLSLYAKSL